MALNKVEICGVNTSRLPVLTNEEKEALFERIKKGDTEARERYIKGNLRLVLSVIKRFSSSNENADDLFQIGCVGLMKAIDNFDTTLNVKFSTYAVPMIIGEIRRYLRDNNSIRVSRSLRDTAYKAIYAKENYMKQNLKEPTLNEIAEEIGIEKEEIVYALDAIQSPVSLYEPVYTEGGDTLYVMDQISDKKNKEEDLLKVIQYIKLILKYKYGKFLVGDILLSEEEYRKLDELIEKQNTIEFDTTFIRNALKTASIRVNKISVEKANLYVAKLREVKADVGGV